MNMKTMSLEIGALDKEIERLKARRKDAVKQRQKECGHERLAECSYRHSEYGSSTPEWRICLDCCMTEEGWGPGFIVLASRGNIGPAKIERGDVYQMRRGLHVDDKMKGPLIRREVTLWQLIEETQ